MKSSLTDSFLPLRFLGLAVKFRHENPKETTTLCIRIHHYTGTNANESIETEPSCRGSLRSSPPPPSSAHPHRADAAVLRRRKPRSTLCVQPAPCPCLASNDSGGRTRVTTRGTTTTRRNDPPSVNGRPFTSKLTIRLPFSGLSSYRGGLMPR